MLGAVIIFICFSSRRRHTRRLSDWSSDVCSSDLSDTASRGIRPKKAAAPRSDAGLSMSMEGTAYHGRDPAVGRKGCWRQECSISGTKKRTGAGWLAWKDDPVAFCAETDERTKGVRGIEGC